MNNKIPELELIIWPDKTLKTLVAPLPEKEFGTRTIKNVAGAMIKTMYKYSGVGLSAQQVGVPFQIFVMDTEWVKKRGRKKARIFINPRVVAVGDRAQQLQAPGEGCLSFPYEYRKPVVRLDKLELEWQDLSGKKHRQWFEGFEAITCQHEYDHTLMGRLFIDRLSPMQRDLAIRRAKKIRRRYKKGYKLALSRMKNAPRTFEYNLKRQQAFEAGVREGKQNAV